MKIHFRRILCATDLSEFSNQAVLQAIGMAREFDAKLFICHVIDLPMVSMHGAAFVYPDNQIEEMKAGAIAQIRGLVGNTKLSWEPVVESGPVSTTLCRLVTDKHADLAIVSTHGRTGIRRLFLGSVTERLLRTIACPLLVVTPPEKAGTGEPAFKGFGFKQILVGCDFSDDSGNAVSYGFSLAQEFQAAIHLVHVVEPFVYRDTMLPETMETDTINTVREASQKRMEALVPDEARNWCDVHIACESGKPFMALKLMPMRIRST